MNSLKKGLAVMRCQPFHNGHYFLIKKALESCEKLYIVLGSTQEFRTFKNPFSFEERKTMLTNSINSEDLLKIVIIGLPDIFNINLWGNYVLNNLPEKIDIIFGGENSDLSCYPENINKVCMERNSTPYLSGTNIREFIFNNNPNWKQQVPSGSLKEIEKLLKTGERLWI